MPEANVQPQLQLKCLWHFYGFGAQADAGGYLWLEMVQCLQRMYGTLLRCVIHALRAECEGGRGGRPGAQDVGGGASGVQRGAGAAQPQQPPPLL